MWAAFVHHGEKQGCGLMWLVGAIAVCRSVLATAFPAIRSVLNL